MRFADSLDRKVEDIVQPPNLPIGTYVFAVTKHPETSEIAQGRFEKLTFLLGCISPTEDVDAEALAEYGNPNGTMLRKDFLFTTDDTEEVRYEQSLNNLKNFLSNCGVDINSGSLKEAIAASVNSQVLGEVRHRLDPEDSSKVYQELGKTAPVS